MSVILVATLQVRGNNEMIIELFILAISRDSSRAPLKTPDSEISDEKMSFAENMKLYGSLWCDWRFLLLVLRFEERDFPIISYSSDFLSWLVQLTPYHHLPTMASQLDFADGQGANLVSSLGNTPTHRRLKS